MPRSSIHSLKIRMTSDPCDKYEQITLYYLLSVKYFHKLWHASLNSDIRLSSRPELRYKTNVSINSTPDHPPPGRVPGDSHILVAPNVGFSLLCLPGGVARKGVLNQSKSSVSLKKSRFLLCLLNKWVAALFICLYMLEVSSETYAPFTL